MKEESLIRIRMGAADAHYGGNLVNGSRMLDLFGDIATELTVRHDGDEGLLRAYESIEFLAPVFAGDFIEARGWITDVGSTSRRIEFEAHKVIEMANIPGNESAANVLPKPLLVCRARGTSVVTKDKQRGRQP